MLDINYWTLNLCSTVATEDSVIVNIGFFESGDNFKEYEKDL